MVGALWTGISGLSGSQMGLDNESNNIANVNTIGYKASRVSFADQMYQDSIGKGVTSQDVEKMYKQGSLKLTGVSYDMALAGNGFFQVSDGLDTYYTRAGNFRMGESGALEDVGAKRVQGWAMKTVTTDDINSTDSNTTYFTNDFTKILGNQVIRDATSIDTVVTKATDYTQTASSDSLTIFSGAGYKSASTKISDIELLMSEYNSALIQYAKAEPKPLSSTSSTQSDLMNFDIGSKTLAEGDEVYVHIDGVKYTQSFDTDNATTMKKFSDVLSDTAGFNSYLTGDDTSPYDLDTQTAPEKGIVILEGLVPGSQYRITEFGWTDASNSNSVSKGVVESIKTATKGTGMGHIESLEAVMADLVAGKQMDVYDDITLGGSNFTYQIDVYNKELDTNEIIPTAPLSIASPVTVDDIVAGINANTTATGELADYVKAYNINGSLVIKTLDSNSDVEFVGTLKGDVAASATSASSEVNTINFNADADANGGAFDVTINGTVYPTTIAAADTQAQMAVKVAASINDALDLAPDNTIESVVANGNAVVITYTIDALGTGTSSVSNNTAVTSTTPTIAIATQSQSSTTTVGEKD
ncbi:MAG: flagellar hook basal-body protein, partial [Campylobacterota bacterium]|nr:flagellar hook basal-body protein [Campylobacterota bacterium]